MSSWPRASRLLRRIRQCTNRVARKPQPAGDLLGQPFFGFFELQADVRRALIGIGGFARVSSSEAAVRKQISVMSSTWVWPAENSRMSCRKCSPDRFRATGGFRELFDHPALVARVVEFFTEVPRVGHAVGEDGDDVSGIELDLGLLVIGRRG